MVYYNVQISDMMWHLVSIDLIQKGSIYDHFTLDNQLKIGSNLNHHFVNIYKIVIYNIYYNSMDCVYTVQPSLSLISGTSDPIMGQLTLSTNSLVGELSIVGTDMDRIHCESVTRSNQFDSKKIEFVKHHIVEINNYLKNPLMNPHLHGSYQQSTTDTYYKLGYRDPEYVSYKIENRDDVLYIIYINGVITPITCINDDKYVMYGLYNVVNTMMLIENIGTNDTYETEYPICRDFILMYLLKQVSK